MSSPAAIGDQVADLLAGMLPLAQLDDSGLVDLISQLEHVVHAAQAVQADAMCEVARRAGQVDRQEAERRGRPLVPQESRSEFVSDEIAVMLATTKVDASLRYALALSATGHPAVQDRWRRGTLSARKVQVICDGLVDVSSPAVDALAEQASSYAETHTAPELRRWLARRVIAADPGMAEIRRARAVSDRKVTLSPLPDGVSELYALLPSVVARQIYDCVNAIARASSDSSDSGRSGKPDVRTMDQRRADALIDLVVGRAEPPQVNVQVVVPADTLFGESAEPADVAGVGPITGTEALELVGDPVGDITFRRMLTDPDSGYLVDVAERRYRPSTALDRAVRARDRVCRFPSCSRPATRGQGTDLDHTTPWPLGQTTASNLAVLCRHHHLLKHSPGWTAELLPDGVMQWTAPSGKTFRTEPWVYADTG
ncbi:MAG: DUF222 domain-containing protein [Actinomycetes bacterium]